jgi:hypothetical protein
MVIRRQDLEWEGRSSRHSMPSRGTTGEYREPLRRARSVTSKCSSIRRMADCHFITRRSKNFCRGRGNWIGGTFDAQAKPGLGRNTATSAVGGTPRGNEGIIHLVFALLRHSCLRILPQGTAGSSFSWQRSWNRASVVKALWQGFESGSRAGEVQEEDHPLGAQQERGIITVAVATAIGGQKQHHCRLDSSWRLVVRVRERRGFRPLALSFSPWAARRRTRASAPTSQSCSPNRLKKRKTRLRHHQCHQAERKGKQQLRNHCWKLTARGRNPCKFPRHHWGQLLRASPRRSGGRCGKASKKDMAGHASWRTKAYVRRLRHILQATVHPPPVPRIEAIPCNLI